MMMHLMARITAGLILAGVSAVDAADAPPSSVPSRVAVSLTMPTVSNLIDALVEIRYRNTGTDDLRLYPPDKAPEQFRGLAAVVNLAGVKYHVKGEAKQEQRPDNSIVVKSHAEYVCTVRLRTVWQMPLSWELIEFRLTDLDRPTGKDGTATIENGSERFIFAAQKTTTPDRRSEIRFARVFEPMAKVSVTPKKAPGTGARVVTVTYTNTGKGPLALRLSDDSHVPRYRELSIISDGQPVPYANEVDPYKDELPAVTRQLAPGESASLDVPMKVVWRMPEKWESMAIRFTGHCLPGNAAGIATIEGLDQVFRFTNDNPR